MIPRAWLAVAGLAACAFCGWQGFEFGVRAEAARAVLATAALNDRLADQAQALNAAAARIEADRQTREQMAREIEDEARADPGACRPSDAVRLRLGTRWSAPPGTP